MKTQEEMLQEVREDYAAKLGGLQAYIRELNERADAHDAEDEHYQADLMRAENDASYYEAELRAMGAAPSAAGFVARPLPRTAQEALPVGLMLVGAAAVGAFLAHLLSSRR